MDEFKVGVKVKVLRASDWAGWTRLMTEELVGNEYIIESASTMSKNQTVELGGGWYVPIDVLEIVKEEEPLQSWERF